MMNHLLFTYIHIVTMGTVFTVCEWCGKKNQNVEQLPSSNETINPSSDKRTSESLQHLFGSGPESNKYYDWYKEL